MGVIDIRSPERHHRTTDRLSANVAWLGIVSLLTAMSSAMVYGLLPIFLVKVLGANAAVLGAIEGTAEAATSLMKAFSGPLSDWFGRRKPLVVLGYALSALNKLLFPMAEAVHTVLAARVIDRLGKGIRDAPRDAFLADLVPWHMRGSGFGLRLTFATLGYVLGPLAAIVLMAASGDNFRLVFWIAVIPAFASVGVLILIVKERPVYHAEGERRQLIRREDLARFAAGFWWAIAIASLFSLARFSQAFLVLKVFAVGVDVAFAPIIIMLTHLVYSASAYPFGVLADRVDRRLLLACGAVALVGADVSLAAAGSIWLTLVGAALWGLQSGMTQGLLAALVADAAPDRLRGTAFGIYDLAVGATTFAASAAAGLLWAWGGPSLTFVAGACVAAAAGCMLLLPVVKPSEMRS
jgi:MFS family permease